MKKFIVLIMIAGLFIQGCSVFAQKVQPTPTFQTGSEQGLPISVVIYADDFSNPASGWQTDKNYRGSYIAYEHQGLRIFVNEAQYDYWSTSGFTAGDARIAVDASKLGGPDDNYYGVVCRLIDNKNFYAFLISSDGYYGILKVKDGVYNLISGSNMDYSNEINRGRGTNRVRGDCIGTDLTLFVNGIQLGHVQNADFTTGKTGLIAGSHDVIGVDILFDNFTVYQP
jgi:hypothetical protein